jgi:hypothetical protein
MASQSAQTIAAHTIFVERDGWVYYVTNWQKRFNEPARPKLVRLSPRHFVRYQEFKQAGRSPKTIAYLLFKKAAVKVTAAPVVEITRPKKPADERTVTVDIAMLTQEQVLSLLQRALGERFPGLRTMALAEIRRLYLAVQALKRQS